MIAVSKEKYLFLSMTNECDFIVPRSWMIKVLFIDICSLTMVDRIGHMIH